ncbi:FAD-dependent oxidoreductase [Pelagibius sp. CAU 1746]|uniref:NAD(P)/FAD-dependent oxidoreductase n=1 Tax=Pelagibius sp. CAU 1746 TaxID=3140370 RepID=UPI00325A76A9
MPASSESGSYDAVIIGAGVIGAAIGMEMARAGYKTLNVDALPAAGYGPTSNSCAIIRVHYSTLDGTAMAYDGYFDWRDWPGTLGVEDERGHAIFHHCGCLIMKTEQNKGLAGVLKHVEALDIPHEHWDAERIRQAIPGYDLKTFWPARRMEDPDFGTPNGGAIGGGVFFPTAGYISDPQLASHNLQRAAEAAGGAFLFNRKVVEIPVENGRVQGVVLDDGTRIAAPIVVNVAGPHSSQINRLAGAAADMRITTKPLRQEVVHLDSPEGLNFEKDGIVVSDSDIACYIRPETGNHILVGSEDPECDPREVVDPDDYNRDLTDQAVTQAYRYAQRLPKVPVSQSPKGVVDLYDVTEDWIPIYDRSCIDGFYMAIGTSGNQFKNAGVAGRLMTALIGYVEGGGDQDAQPLAFKLKHLERTIDTATFSRRREINPDSSFSVLG